MDCVRSVTPKPVKAASLSKCEAEYIRLVRTFGLNTWRQATKPP